MSLRARILWLVAILLTSSLAGLAWVAGGMLSDAANIAASLAAARPQAAEQLAAAVAAADLVTWLAAAALLALSLGVAVTLLRGWLFGPLRVLQRRLDADPRLPVRQGDLLSRLDAALVHYRGRMAASADERADHLDVVDAYRASAADAQARLAAADRLTIAGQLAMGAAHEIGGPLSIAMVCLDSLSELGTDPESLLRYRDQATEALDRVDAILRELSEFGLPTSAASATPVAVVALVERVLRLARLHKRCRSIALDLRVDPTVGDSAAAIPPRHLEQVVLNLLINAADAVQGEGEVSAAISLQDGRVLVEIADAGPGVPEILRERIFEPFFTTKAPGAGSGLGLAVSRRLVVDAGGTLGVAPAAGAGARFVIDLPRAESVATTAARTGSPNR